jgi:hypothetical protein
MRCFFVISLYNGCDIKLLCVRTEQLVTSNLLPDLLEYRCPPSNPNMKNPHLHTCRRYEEAMMEDAVAALTRIDPR